MLQRGQILQGNYRIVRLLSQGGMGAVYLAEHTRLMGQLVAIKENIFDPSIDQATQHQLRQQFYVEAKTLAALNHPNLPKVTDFFIHGGIEYLVMDYVQGDDLSQVLAMHLQRMGRPLPERQVLVWADQILSALAYLHSRQPNPVIHRDIKPANIILAPDGKVYLVDFGLVKLLNGVGQSTAAAMRGMGTPGYTALEQYGFGAGHTDARTDLYALGATLYHLLTGQAPPEVPQRVLNPRGLASPKQLNPALAPSTASTIIKALEIQPDRRHQNARDMRAALAGTSAYHGQPGSTRRSPVRLAWILSGGAITLVALVFALILSSEVSRREAPPMAGVAAVVPAATETATPERAATDVIVATARPSPTTTATRILRLASTSTLQPTPVSLPTNTPTNLPQPTSTSPPRPTQAAAAPSAAATLAATAAPAVQEPSASWVLVADSVADFPGPIEGRKWWYLWSSGRNNFEWQEMSFDGGCYRSPNDWGLQICRDLVTSGARGDVALQYKVQQGGTYRIEWQADPGILFYRHLGYVSSGHSGSQIFEDLIDWEMFFFVVRNSGTTRLAVQVYRLQP